jgi:hypothetical protein
MPDVFFYGLFMDRALLADKGLQPEEHNADYAAKLKALAVKLELRAEYVESIK